MYTKLANKNQLSWLVVLFAICSLFAMTQLTAQATYCLVHVEFVNDTDEKVKVYWEDYHGGETLYKSLRAGRSWGVNTYEGHEWVVRDLDGNFIQAYTVDCHDDTVVIAPAPGEVPPVIEEPPAEGDECECVDGVTQMTIELTHRTSSADRHERVRARVGGLGGDVLFDTYNDGNPYGHNGIYEGESFTIDVNPGDTIAISVQGGNHRHEYVKAEFTADCSLAVGDESGNSYIMFEVIELTDDSETDTCDEEADIIADGD